MSHGFGPFNSGFWYKSAQKELREKLDVLGQGIIDQQRKEEMGRCRRELEHLYMDEEIYWRQRCKNQWAKEGDRNTRFFHAKASKRRSNNKIPGLQNQFGEWKDKVEDIEQIIQEYFGTLFQISNPSTELIDEILQNVNPVVTPAMNQ